MSDTNYPKAVISTSEGDMTVELWNDVAPGHVDNFLTLGRDGFYNDLIFHRIIPNFVIQGGCPHGMGNGDAGKKIKAESGSGTPHLRNVSRPIA